MIPLESLGPYDLCCVDMNVHPINSCETIRDILRSPVHRITYTCRLFFVHVNPSVGICGSQLMITVGLLRLLVLDATIVITMKLMHMNQGRSPVTMVLEDTLRCVLLLLVLCLHICCASLVSIALSFDVCLASFSLCVLRVTLAYSYFLFL